MNNHNANFIEAWGSLAGLLGFNPSTARVHALLMAEPEPLTLDQIASRLGISRGNASMCLKELRGWAVVRRTSRPRERRDYFASEPDVWKMAVSIARERKRREFDPALARVREALGEIEKARPGPAAERIRGIEELLATLDRVGSHVLADERAALAVVGMLRDRAGGEAKD